MSWEIHRPGAARQASKAVARTLVVNERWLIVKIAGGVLMALLAWRSIELYLLRLELEELGRETEAMLKPDLAPGGDQGQGSARIRSTRSAAAHSVSAAVRRALPEGYRCVAGTVIYTAHDGAMRNITARSNYWYCPPGGKGEDCWLLTPAAVGCR
ncbi:MAG TPA: hypothetical protein PK027_03110 [Aquimonas sp.]|jgi:hypothetical protein|nr:hypothetical protein [Xanthomonadales bacterium]HRD71728.1 hypothetical protein [Aquimonas sp.]HRF53436.1 hypothetical protein [Aquimonas sp.]